MYKDAIRKEEFIYSVLGAAIPYKYYPVYKNCHPMVSLSNKDNYRQRYSLWELSFTIIYPISLSFLAINQNTFQNTDNTTGSVACAMKLLLHRVTY